MLNNVSQGFISDSITNSITARDIFVANTGYVVSNFINCNFWDEECVMRFKSVHAEILQSYHNIDTLHFPGEAFLSMFLIETRKAH